MSLFGSINYLISNYYRFYRDPYGNMVIGLPSNDDELLMRKYKLRKELYDFAVHNSDEILEIKMFDTA